MTSTTEPAGQSSPNRPPASRPTTQILMGCVVIPMVVVLLIGGGFLWLRAGAATALVVPPKVVVLVRTLPDEKAPLLARFGEGQLIKVIGRSTDWRWLAIELWDGRTGWVLRPLDILIWRIDAEPLALDQVEIAVPTTLTPVLETMIEISATTFTMGSPPGLGEADEQPAHPVTLSAFAIDRTEVTVGQYWTCVIAGECSAPPQDDSQASAQYLNDPAFDNHPVVNISWEAARQYCTWRGQRLPTEAEWEAAAGWDARRGAKLLWPWGNDETPPDAVNLGSNAATGPVVVGSSSADVSAAGVMDMAGNVSEWVFDWYKVDYYSVADDTDPQGPTQRRGEGSGRGVRGGAFSDDLANGRTARRSSRAETYGYPMIGFRCAQRLE